MSKWSAQDYQMVADTLRGVAQDYDLEAVTLTSRESLLLRLANDFAATFMEDNNSFSRTRFFDSIYGIVVPDWMMGADDAGSD